MLGLAAHTSNSSTLKTEEDCKFEAIVGYHGKCQANQPVKKKKKKDFSDTNLKFFGKPHRKCSCLGQMTEGAKL